MDATMQSTAVMILLEVDTKTQNAKKMLLRQRKQQMLLQLQGQQNPV